MFPSKFLACSGFALCFLCGNLAANARAAAPRAKNATTSKQKPAELGDAITKQLQWEDKVMGPNDKRAELDKIARAQAITKAATEKAERDKAEQDRKAERQAARDAAQPKAARTSTASMQSTTNKKEDVAIPSVPEPERKPVAAEAPPPAPPAKPADDRFIDRLLKDEAAGAGAGRKKTSSRSEDKELDQLLAGSQEKPVSAKGKSKKGDLVDNLLESADKQPAVKTKATVPEWTKPEIASTPAAAPAVARPQPRKDDGVIHVVQGAATPSSPARPAPVVARVTNVATNRRSAAQPASWTDPFADSGPKKKTIAARDPFADEAPAATTRRMPAVPAARPGASKAVMRAPASASWNDPFADTPNRDKTTPRRAPAAAPAAAPAKKGEGQPGERRERRESGESGWKDPFTTEDRPVTAAHAAVVMRGGEGRGGGGRWSLLKSAHRARTPSPGRP